MGKGKTRLSINRKVLAEAIKEAEKDGPLATCAALWEKTAILYNAKTKESVSAATIAGRVKEFDLDFCTVVGRKGKPTIQVCKTTLQKAIDTAEKDGPLENRSTLYEAVAENYNSLKSIDFKAITPSVVYLRINEFKLTMQTPKGKRGGDGSQLHKNRGQRVKKADKFKASSEAQEVIRKLRAAEIPERFNRDRYLTIIDGIEAGSRTAGSKLHCLQCSNFQTAEIKNCVIQTCGSFLFRPYQGTASADEEGEETESEKELVAVEAA